MWVREWLARRHEFGHYDQLLTELHKEDPRGYRNCLRITPDLFQEMVEKLTPHIKKETTFMQEPLAVGLKLAATLSFLVTRNSYPIIQYSFKDEATILPEVCKAIIQSTRTKCSAAPKLKRSERRLLKSSARGGTTTTVWGQWMANTLL